MASFFTLQNNNNVYDGANGESLLSHLGASAADFIPYEPILLRRRRGDNSNCSYSPLAPSAASSTSSSSTNRTVPAAASALPPLVPLSQNQRRKRNRRNPPAPPSLPPTVGALVEPAQPQPGIFPNDDFSGYLLLWMNTYNPLINSRLDFSVRRNSEFNYGGDFKGWCLGRGIGFSAACA